VNSFLIVGLKNRFAILLLTPIAVVGLLAAACSSSDSNGFVSIANDNESGEEAEGQGANSPTPETQASPSPSGPENEDEATADNPEIPPESDDPQSSDQATSGSQEDEPVSMADRYDDYYDAELSCFEQSTFSEEKAIRHSMEMVDDIMQAFPALDQSQARSLAIAYGLCEVEFSEVQALLEEGELGRQYRNMIQGLASESYQEFVEVYVRQQCLVVAYDLNYQIETDSRLHRLIGAVGEASLIHFRPGAPELLDVAMELLGELTTAFERALENGFQDDDDIDDLLSQELSCERYKEIIGAAGAAA